MEFFARHSATIVNVCFRSMRVTDTDWSSDFPRSRNLTFPVLKRFNLRFRTDGCVKDMGCRVQD